MGTQRTTSTWSAMQRWITHLLLAACLVRAFIPAGYMPDLSTSSNGGLRLVICTANGTQIIALDENGKPAPKQQSDDHSGPPCVLTGSAAVTLPSLMPLVPLLVGFEARVWIHHAVAHRPPVRAGPPLGSRGPPLFS